MGFTDVSDYVDGKADWFAAGYPFEGTSASSSNAGGIARKDPPTCSVKDKVGDAAKRAATAGVEASVVVNEQRVVLGILRGKQLKMDPEMLVEKAMRSGPSTYRPNVGIADMAKVMIESDLPNVPVTTSDGVLVGLLLREDAERAAHAEHVASEESVPGS